MRGVFFGGWLAFGVVRVSFCLLDATPFFCSWTCHLSDLVAFRFLGDRQDGWPLFGALFGAFLDAGLVFARYLFACFLSINNYIPT